MLVTNYAIKLRVAVFVFVLVMTILGVISYVNLPREGAPDITIPYVFVTAPYEGVAPAEIENLVTIPMEKKFKDLENVKQTTSVSSEGMSLTVIEFTPKENLNNALQRVKDKVDEAQPDLPDDLDNPLVDVINFSTDWPIVTLVLAGNTDLERLKALAEDLQEEIENVPGVKSADIFGTREREIRVEIDPQRLVAYRFTLGAVMRAIAAENRTVSAGNLEMTGGKFQVRIPGEFKLVSEMRGIVVGLRDGKPIYLTDVAALTDTFKDLSSVSRINGKPSVSLQVKKRSGENTVRLVKQIKKILAGFTLPPGVDLTITGDQSVWIADMLNELENNVFSGFVLVVVVLFIFMGRSNSFFVAMAIPLSMLITFVIMSWTGATLNFIVLFALVMATGMLVDNGIVIVENIYRLRCSGLSRLDAARQGAAEVAWPVTTSTLTTVAAFWPLLNWPDIMGQFMSYLPKTLIITLLSSLFVGLVVNPAICSVYVSERKGEAQKTHPFVAAYERFLRAALRHRGWVMVFGLAFLVLTMQLYGRFGRGIELFPDVQPRSAAINVSYPQGTDIAKTDETLRSLEQKLFKYPDIKYFLTTVGAAGGHVFGGGGAGTQVGNIYVEFKDQAERKQSSLKTVEQMRDDMGIIPGADVTVEREKEGPPTGAPISIEVAGEDFETLSYLAGEIQRAVKGVPGVVDIKDDLEEARPELQFRVDRQRAALLGLDTDTIGGFLRSAIYGAESSKFRAGEDEYDITVRLPESDRRSANLLSQIYIPVESGQTVPLSSLGQVVYTGGRGDITRKDRKRVVTITGDIEQRSVDAVLADVRKAVGKIPLPVGYEVSYSGENEDINENFAFLSRAFGIAVAMIAVILVLEFNSAVLPALIMVSVILSMIGVMWGLMLCRMRFGVIMTGLGVISLAGVVVNNSIVLIDCMLQKRKAGLSDEEAAVAAGRQRLRPVLLTAGTTVLGLIPMAVGWSVEIHTWPWKFVAGAESSQWWAPMAVAIIFGLTLATLLTLVQVPVMYMLAERAISGVRRRFFASRENNHA
ncbi:MAG: efflux RND transporter permease subunit [Verrucomicrobiota bacterium]